ncbi:unnamed protein product [Rhodiola kirilowii]
MSNLAQTVSELKRAPGRLPSQTVPNPRGNIKIMAVVDKSGAENNKNESELVPIVSEGDISSTLMSEADASITLRSDAPITSTVDATRTDAQSQTDPSPSFSMQVIAPKDDMIDEDELGGRLEARHEQNDPIMERPLATSHEAPLGKSKDPGAFTVTCGISETQIHPCLIDLGAAVNAMPYSLYCSLRLGPLKPHKLLIELGDKSCVRPVGLLEDLTLHVGDLVVPVDFYVLQIGDARNDDPPTLILGRPFLFATKTKIDMDTGLLSLAFGRKTSDFYIYEDDDRPCAKKPPDIVRTPYLGALPPNLPDETNCAARPVATSKVSSQTQEDVKVNPPDRWRADMSTPFHEGFGQFEGIAEAKFDLTCPWDPNL